jgi:hypothetical protein
MKLPFKPLFVALQFSTLTSLWSPPAIAETRIYGCDRSGVYVSAKNETSVSVACQAVEDALGFLAPLGLTIPNRLVVELVEQLPPDLRADAVGCYVIATRRLMVLEESLFLARRTWFGIPTSRALFRSVIAHEAAHALVGCALDGRKLVNAGHEYIAYVTMFASMEAPTRAAAMTAMPGKGLQFNAEINDMRYALDPMTFGLEAYRHWLKQPDGMAFLKSVFEGKVAVDLPL